MTLLNMALSGSALASAVLLLRPLLGHRLPRWTFTVLWWVVLLRLLVPLAFPSPFSVYTLFSIAPESQPVWTEPTFQTPAGTVPLFPATGGEPLSSPAFSLEGVWLAGAALCLLWLLASRRKLTVLLKQARPLGVFRPSAGPGRPIPLYSCPGLDSPMTCGLLHPAIYLPQTPGFFPEDPALTFALAHEYAHIRRGDLWCKALLAAALCLHWYNPLLWLVRPVLERDLELACDEAAVLSLGCGCRRDYALSLLRWAQAEDPSPALCRFSNPSLKERIIAVMELKPRSIGAWAAALALIAALTAAFATSPVAEPLSDTPSPAPSAPLTWCWPVEGSYPISSPFYLSRIHPVTQLVVSHPGVDIAAPARTHVLAAADGTADTGFDSSRGFWVLLEHPDGHSTLYTHLAEVLVSAGDQVCAGSTLGTVGNTGRSTGPHLHFELWDSQGSPLDPMDLFS